MNKSKYKGGEMQLFFNSWNSIFRLVATSIIFYPVIIILLRLYGKRSLSKLNMFDFIITVALGSAFASTLFMKDATIIDGAIAFIMLLSLQYLVTWSSFQWKSVDKLVKSEPVLLLQDGKFLKDNMEQERVTEDEIYAEIRQNGLACLSQVYAVVLETNGILSVIQQVDNIEQSTLIGVRDH